MAIIFFWFFYHADLVDHFETGAHGVVGLLKNGATIHLNSLPYFIPHLKPACRQ